MHVGLCTSVVFNSQFVDHFVVFHVKLISPAAVDAPSTKLLPSLLKLSSKMSSQQNQILLFHRWITFSVTLIYTLLDFLDLFSNPLLGI